jgi:cell division protease FtsH
MKGNWSRNAFVYLLILVAGAALFFNIYRPDEAPQEITLSQLAESIQQGKVDQVSVHGEEIKVFVEGAELPLVTRREEGVPITETLTGLGVTPEELADVKITYEPPGNAGNWMALLINLLPLVFIVGLFFVLFRQTQGSNNQALSFGKSKARLLSGDTPTITFAI